VLIQTKYSEEFVFSLLFSFSVGEWCIYRGDAFIDYPEETDICGLGIRQSWHF